ncbi:MAG TPA: ABC transporter permease [Candidatus Dormibacteraeota bacterium]|jgi:ABC-2 type transport system permease protein|nr:ABC transporter permease [Candidatus Dormibacteraeota bacterium]
MSTQANAVAAAPAEIKEIRPFYWSVRRELWEHRAIYVGPLAATAVFLAGFLITLGRLPHEMRELAAMDSMSQHDRIVVPYDMAAGLLMLVQILVSVFYCLDAFQSERRDRSILFWKSLPVSDRTTVLAKASVPLAILPFLIIVCIVFLQLAILLLSALVLSGSGQSTELLWRHAPWFRMALLVSYHILMVHTLWYAPFYGWLLFVSAWARRATYLWAFLPLLAAGFLEKILFNTAHFADFLTYRLGGGTDSVAPVGRMPIDTMTHLTPLHFLATPGLWIGFGLTAAFLAAAERLRRYREPS